MAVLSLADRQRIARWIQRDQNLGDTAFLQTQLLAAVTAADTWLDDNAVAYNAALPAAFRNSATPAQKAIVLAYAMIFRWGLNPLQDGGE